MYKSLILLLATFALAGCAGGALQPVPLTDADRTLVETSGSVTVAMVATPPFLFQTPGTALVGAGMARWNDPGAAPSWGRYTSEHNVPDFTDTVREKFLAGLRDHGSPVSFSTADEREPYSPKLETAYVRQYATDYVLEVRTQYGGFSYGPLSWKTYFMNYSGLARLVRTTDEAVIWQGTCVVSDNDHDELAVPAADFMEGNGEQFRAAADKTTSECARQLVAAYSAAR